MEKMCWNCGQMNHKYRVCPTLEVEKRYLKAAQIQYSKTHREVNEKSWAKKLRRENMTREGPTVPVQLLSHFMNIRINDLMLILDEWRDIIEYPIFSRNGKCVNKKEIKNLEDTVRKLLPEIMDITSTANCYKKSSYGLNYMERDLILSDMGVLKYLRDKVNRVILPACAEAVLVEEFADYIYEREEEQRTFFAECNKILSGRPELKELKEIQRRLDNNVAVINSVKEKHSGILRTEHRLHGPAFVKTKMVSDFDDMRAKTLAAWEDAVARKIESGVAEQNGKFDCKICLCSQITHVFPVCGHACCSACLPYLHSCHQCRKPFDYCGPLEHVETIGNETVTTLVGLTYFGVGCARPRFPGVYTEVSYFASWITGTIDA